MTSDEFNQTCRDICHHCDSGVAVRQRTDNREWVHDIMDKARNTLTHSICLATNWRNKNKDSVVG